MKYAALSKEELDRLTARLLQQATEIALRLRFALGNTDVPDPTSSTKDEKSDD